MYVTVIVTTKLARTVLSCHVIRYTIIRCI